MKATICFRCEILESKERLLKDVQLNIKDLSNLKCTEVKTSQLLIEGCIRTDLEQEKEINGNIVCIGMEACCLFLTEKKYEKSSTTVIVPVDIPKNHFITLHCNFRDKKVILMDSFQSEYKLKMYQQLKLNLNSIMKDLHFSQIRVSTKNEVDDGFFQAFVNSLIVEWSKCLTIDKTFQSFLKEIDTFQGILKTKRKCLIDQKINMIYDLKTIAKERIKSGYAKGETLDEIKSSENTKYQKLPRDCVVYFELYYAKQVAKSFLSNLEAEFKTQGSSFRFPGSLVQHILEIKDIKEPFSTVKNYEQLQRYAEFLDPKAKLHFLKSFHNLCLCNSTPAKHIEIKERKCSDELLKLINYLASTMPPELRKCLQDAKENSENTDKFILYISNDKSLSCLKQCSTDFITENGKEVFRCHGMFFDLDTVNTKINSQQKLFEQCAQIEIQAELYFCVNCNVKWPEKNVLIVTDTLIVDDGQNNYSLEVSGSDGHSHEQKTAQNGTRSERDGLAGEPGMHGESGGNVQIIADVYKNEANMSVISNGGNGSCGQDGGVGADGIDGVDGKGISSDEFNRRFPDVACFSASDYVENFRIFKKNNKFTSKSEEIETGDFTKELLSFTNERTVVGGKYYCKGETDDKYEVEYGCYTNEYVPIIRESYCICFGQQGTPGKQGGNGGKGGVAGKGGFGGKVDIRNWKGKPILTIPTTSRSGDPGFDGKNGKGGKGGKNGKRGYDRAHICPSSYKSTKEYVGYLKIVTSETRSGRAYCPRRKKYIDVNKTASPCPTLQKWKDGYEGENTKRVNNQMTEPSRNKNAPIDFDTIKMERSKLFFCGKTNNKHFEDINKVTLTMEENFISKYSLKHQRYVIKESKQRKENGMQNNQLLPISTTRNIPHLNSRSMLSSEEDSRLMRHCNTVLTSLKDRSNQSFPKQNLRTILEMLSQISIQNSFDKKHYTCFLELFYLIKNKCGKPNTNYNYWYDSIMINSKFWLLSEANIMTRHYINEKRREMDIHDPYSITLLGDLQIGLNILFEDLILKVLKTDDHNDVAHLLNTTTQSIQTNLDDLMQEIKEYRRTVPFFGENVSMCVAKVVQGFCEHTKKGLDSKGEIEIENQIVSNKKIRPLSKTDAEFADVTDDDETCVSPDINDLLEWASTKTTNKTEICCVMKKLRYINSDQASLILKCLKYRLINQRCQIVDEFLFLFLIKLLENEEVIQDRNYIKIVAATKPENWIFEWIIQELVCHSDEPDELIYREQVSKIDESIHLFLCRYMSKLEDGEIMSTNTIEAMMKNLQAIHPDVSDSFLLMLGKTNVFEWKYKIQWLKTIKALECFSWTGQSTLLDAAYYSRQIINRIGQRFIDEIYSFVRKYQVDEGIFLSALKKICTGSLNIDIQDLQRVQSSKEAFKMLCHNCQHHDRSTSEKILSLMEVDYNSSLHVDTVDTIRTYLNDINKKGAQPSKLLANTAIENTNRNDYTTKEISSFTEDDIKRWSQVCMQELKLHAEQFNNMLAEMIAIIDKAIQLKKEFVLRNTQKIAIIAFLLDLDTSHKGLLQQMSTGEGKTMVIVALSILKALKGEKVDIITSSPVLAKRDSFINKDIFNLFMISVSNNCGENKHDRQEAYSSLVVYGEIGMFQRDLLLTEFYEENIIGGRHRKNVIVDEVDSMLLDRGETVLYLSHEIAGMDALEFVYIYIWSLVNVNLITGTNEDHINIRKCTLDAIYGVISMEDIRECSPPTNAMNVHDIWKILQNENIIDHEGRLLTRSYGRFEELEKKGTNNECGISGYITNMLKDIVRKGILVEVPNFLDSYIIRHLDTWIQNAFRAKYMEEEKHFIIDIDRTENGRGKNPNIIIMDIDTGTEQYNMQWNSGLHQFLQLKYKCAISASSLKAVFMSNISFFRLYKNLYGLTGTLGSQKERNLLKDMFNVIYITIPTFQEPKFVEEETIVCESTTIWMKSITETAVTLSKSRPILVICETIHSCNSIEKEFKHKGVFVYVYKNSYCELSILKNKTELDTGCIILATNLAGRGTDITISENISMLGGLHVILTYLPSNLRIEEQAFGRAARKGQQGSGQLIICECFEGQCTATEKFSIARMKIQRDTNENERISKIQQRYESFILSEEKLFKAFQNFYDKLKLKLISGKTDAEFQKVILQALVDRWAFWLDSVESSLETSKDFSTITDNLKDFFKEVDVSEDNADNSKIMKMLRSPSQLVKAGKAKTSLKQFIEAQAFFDHVIDNDTLFSETALYYKVHNLLKTGDWTADDYTIVRNSLRYCKCLIQQRIEKIRNSVQIVNVFSSQYTKERDTFNLSEGFVGQKENVIQIYYQFIDSIDSITGYTIEPAMFVDATCSHLNAHMLFSDLVKMKIVSPQKVCAFSLDQRPWQTVKKMYELYSEEIYLQLQTMKEWDSATAEHLQNILPSREELWALLIRHGVLTDNQDYILLFEGAFQRCCALLPRHITNIVKSLKGNGTDIEQYIFLYPDQKDSILLGEARLIPSCLFKDNLGFGKIFEVLQKEKVISHCSLALIATNVVTTLESKFDNVKQDSFVAIGVTTGTSKDIFDQLVENNFITSDGRLQTNELGSIWLNSFSSFTTEIRNIVAKCSKYRICANYLLKEREFPIDLFSHPHENLFRDLIEVGIITTLKVNANMSEDEMTQQLKFLYGYECERQITPLIKILDFKKNSSTFDRNQTMLEAKTKKGGEIDIDVFFSAYPRILLSEIDELCQGSSFTNSEKELIDKMICVKNDSSKLWYLTVAIKNYEITTKAMNQEVSDCENEINCLISSRIKNCKNTPDIVARLKKWRECLVNFENCDTELISLGSRFNEEQLIVLCDEILSITHNGFGELITLQERKWTTKSVCKMIVILAIGLIQIGIAIAIEFYSIGTGTFVANAFLSEGIGDIVFAIECMISGHCTMMSYLQHKQLSLVMTAASAGIGALVARGAQFSRFGHKIGGQFLQKHTGKALIKNGASKRLLAKAAAKWIGKKLIEVTSMKLVDKGVDFVIETAIRTSLVKICDIMTEIGPTVGSEILTELHASLSNIAKKMDKRNAEKFIKQLIDKCFKLHKSDVSMFLYTVGKLGNTFCDGLSVAIEKMQYTGNSLVKCLEMIKTTVNAITKCIDVVNAVQEVAQLRLLMLKKFINEVEAQLPFAEITIDFEVCGNWVSNQAECVICTSNTEVSKYIENQLEVILVKPLLQTVGCKLNTQISRRVKTLYRYGKKCLHYSHFKRLKEEFQPKIQQASSSDKNDEMKLQYNKKLINLLMKTRNPDLFAEIVEEGVPLGIHSVQAVAEIAQAVINIESIGCNDITMPKTFTPSGADNKKLKSITLQFIYDRETCIGHFLSQNNTTKEECNQFDCLLTAVMQETGQNLDRKDLAKKIRNNLEIQGSIEQGIHEHTITMGGIGGVKSKKKKHLDAEDIVSRHRKIKKLKADLSAKEKIAKELNDLKLLESVYHEKDKPIETERIEIQKKIKKENKSFDKSLRDRAKISNNFEKPTGNDELYEIHLAEMWANMSLKNSPEYVKPTHIYFNNQSEDVDYIKLFYTARLDICYCLHTKDDKLQGHPGALFNNKEDAKSKNSGGLTSGSKYVHADRTKVAMTYKDNHLLSFLYVLKKHIETLPTKSKLEKLDIKNCYSSTGLNLENGVDKAKYIKGLEREKYKLCSAAEFLIKQNKFNESKGKRVEESKQNNIEKLKRKNSGGSNEKHNELPQETHNKGQKETHNEGPKETHNEGPKETHNKGPQETNIKGEKETHNKGQKETHNKGQKETHNEGPKETHNEGSKETHNKGPQETNIKGEKETHNEGTKETHNEGTEGTHDGGPSEKPMTKSFEEHMESLGKAFSELKPTIDPEDKYIKRTQDDLNKVENMKALGNLLQVPAPTD